MSPRDQTLLCLSRPWRRGEWGVTWLQHNCKCNQPWRPACKPQRNCYLTWSDGLQVVTASCGHCPGEEGGERRVTRLFLKSMISAVELCWDWCWSWLISCSHYNLSSLPPAFLPQSRQYSIHFICNLHFLTRYFLLVIQTRNRSSFNIQDETFSFNINLDHRSALLISLLVLFKFLVFWDRLAERSGVWQAEVCSLHHTL